MLLPHLLSVCDLYLGMRMSIAAAFAAADPPSQWEVGNWVAVVTLHVSAYNDIAAAVQYVCVALSLSMHISLHLTSLQFPVWQSPFFLFAHESIIILEYVK
jgi:hypothetical protein